MIVFFLKVKRKYVYLWQDFLWGWEEISVDYELRGYVAVLLLQQQMAL